MKNIIRILSLLAMVLLLNGCATPLGYRYGNMGGLAGAAIGGAAGGLPGAIIGGAAGAAAGGLYGDEQTRLWYDDQRSTYGGDWRYQYEEPCRRIYVPVYDRYGYVVGRRLECQ